MFPPNFNGYRGPINSPPPPPPETAAIQELQSQVARQNLLLQTLLRMLMAKGVIQEEELQEWIKYMDGLDGTLDGRLRESKAPRACPKCRRMSSQKAVKCQYCGEEMPPVVFDHEQPEKPGA